MTERTLREQIEALTVYSCHGWDIRRGDMKPDREGEGEWLDRDSVLRILDAHTATQPAQCCMCGKKGLSTVEGDGGPECQLDDDRWTCSRECWDRATAQPAPDAVAEADDALLSDAYISMRDAMGIIDANEGPGMKHSRILNALADARVRIERRTAAKGTRT